MSERERSIVCRRCREAAPLAGGNCPHCGASIRGNLALVVIGLFGLVLVIASLFALSELLFYGVVGLACLGIASYLLYDKQRRIRAASEGEDEGEGDGDVLGVTD